MTVRPHLRQRGDVEIADAAACVAADSLSRDAANRRPVDCMAEGIAQRLEIMINPAATLLR